MKDISTCILIVNIDMHWLWWWWSYIFMLQALYNTQLQQAQYYQQQQQIYGGGATSPSSSATIMPSPYYYGYSLQAPRVPYQHHHLPQPYNPQQHHHQRFTSPFLVYPSNSSFSPPLQGPLSSFTGAYLPSFVVYESCIWNKRWFKKWHEI